MDEKDAEGLVFFIERPKGPDNCCATSMIIEGSLGKLKVGTMLTSYLQ